MTAEKRGVRADGLHISYLTAGEGPLLLLLHGAGDNALDWRWVLPALARTHHVYAPDFPGSNDSVKPDADYSPAFFERFVAGFLDALGIERAAMVGNSLGGLIALRLALSEPARVGALVLVDSAGLGRSVTFALRSLTTPGYGELSIAWSKTPAGAAGRAWAKARLLFAHPQLAPAGWTAEQYRLAQLPGFLEAALAALRAQMDPGGQREVLLDRLPHLESPTLVVWGALDRVFPSSQGRDAASRLPKGSLALIPECGHMPHVERPDRFAAALAQVFGDRASL